MASDPVSFLGFSCDLDTNTVLAREGRSFLMISPLSIEKKALPSRVQRMPCERSSDAKSTDSSKQAEMNQHLLIVFVLEP